MVNLPANAGNVSLIPGSGRSPGEGNDFCCSVTSDSSQPHGEQHARLPCTVFLPGRSHGQRRLVGYSLWVHKRVGHYLAMKQQ